LIYKSQLFNQRDIIIILLYPFLLISRCVYRDMKAYRPRTSSSVDIISSGR
jgi:hypothetical protein